MANPAALQCHASVDHLQFPEGHGMALLGLILRQQQLFPPFAIVSGD